MPGGAEGTQSQMCVSSIVHSAHHGRIESNCAGLDHHKCRSSAHGALRTSCDGDLTSDAFSAAARSIAQV